MIRGGIMEETDKIREIIMVHLKVRHRVKGADLCLILTDIIKRGKIVLITR